MRAVLLTLTACLLALPASAKYSGGTGEPNDPYQIAKAADLIALGEDPNDYDKHFILTADIDLDPNLPGRKVFDRAVIAPDTNGATWRFEGTSFIGVFDGSGHTISHLKIVGGWSLGVFGRLESAGQIRYLGVVDVSVAGSGGDVGGLAGYSEGDLSGCYSTGVVSADERVGGLIGENEGRLSRCYSTCEVVGRSDVGGLIGSSEGEVTNCYSTGTVSGERWVGGLLGRNDQGDVTYCYSIGPVSGIGAVGGLVGTDEASFGKFSSSFWDTQTSGQAKSTGGTGKTTAEMQTAQTFLDAGWDFVGETANGSEDIWKIAEGLGYPRLSWEKYSGGTGEPNDPYQIATATDLIALGNEPNDYDEHFILIADIDLDPNLPGGRVFDKAVIAPTSYLESPFTGVFDGNSHTISHLTIRSGGFSGLFGALGAGAVVRKLAVVDVNIAGSGDWVGGLAGRSWGGSVDQCYSTGVVDGVECVGGLMGGSVDVGTMTRCYSAGTVRGWRYVGGLVAFSNGRLTECYSAAAVDGSGYVGGLVGSNGGNIISSYSRGSVRGTDHVGGLVGHNRSSISSSFWDVQTSGQATSDGGTGKTTAQMQTAKTFLEAGWDFVGETPNGIEDIWWIDEGKDYPYLWWETRD